MHLHLNRGSGQLAPWQAHKAAGQRIRTAIDIADIPDQSAVFSIVAVDRQIHDCAGQWPAAAIHGEEFFSMQQLAARHTRGVDDKKFEQFDIGMLFEKREGFLFVGECRRHGGTLCA
ncbi:hypothetical protein [Burkholderia pseudomultivorans]|uniref:hypothetical protein n=1 Tax=Burkholderia pseudomultivorans TaxID=1207504 RepID=UPI0018C7EC94|nr:hypothetical protein [Burkholderia pseudomultivorans]